MRDKTLEWKKENEEFCKELTSQLGQAFYDVVVPLTPVKTGTLKLGWKLEKSSDPEKPIARVINDVPYLNYVNNGTRTIKPRRFIEIAYQRTLDEFGRKN